MSNEKLNQIERMLSDLILSVGTIKSVIEEHKGENQKQFALLNERFEQVDRRFDEVMDELQNNNAEHKFMAGRIFQNEMDIQKVKEQFFQR